MLLLKGFNGYSFVYILFAAVLSHDMLFYFRSSWLRCYAKMLLGILNVRWSLHKKFICSIIYSFCEGFRSTVRLIRRMNPVRRLRLSWCVSQYKCFNAFDQIRPLKGRRPVDGPLWWIGNVISSGCDWQKQLEWGILGLIHRLGTAVMLRFIQSLIYILNIDIDWCPFLEMVVVSFGIYLKVFLF